MESSQEHITDYLSGFQYDNGKLSFFPTAEGYVKATEKTSSISGDGSDYSYNYVYNYMDHLGNIRLRYTQDPEEPTGLRILEEDHYYPFGLKHKGYNSEHNIIVPPISDIKGEVIIVPISPDQNDVYRYKFGGKELQEGLGLDWYDFGARNYVYPVAKLYRNATLGRWMNMDPLAEKYYKFSPYAYVGNSPTIAVDPDGRKILFVNGYWNSWIGGIIGSSSPGKKYWGRGFTQAAQNYFNDYSDVNDSNYIDGSSLFGGDSSGGRREEDGYKYAKENYSTLIEGLGEDETFKIVTHSEGGAYGAGIARYLIERGQTVETILHLSTDEGDEFETPEEPDTYQLSIGGDWVTGNKEISKGVDVFGVIDQFESRFDKAKYAHGSTKSASVLNLQKLC